MRTTNASNEDAEGEREADRLDRVESLERMKPENTPIMISAAAGDDPGAVPEARDDRPRVGPAPWTYSSRIRVTRNTW